jgi:hypothetical protein
MRRRMKEPFDIHHLRALLKFYDRPFQKDLLGSQSLTLWPLSTVQGGHRLAMLDVERIRNAQI